MWGHCPHIAIWETVMEYKGKLKQRTKNQRLLYLVGCILLVYLEISTRQYFYVPLTALLFGALILEKSHVISEEGVDIRYEFFGYRINNRWKWEEITGLQPDYKKAAPDVQLLIEKTSMIRPFVYTKEQYLEIIKLAQRMNPDIFIDHYEEEDLPEIERNRERAKAQRRAQEREAKAKKKKKN